MQGIAPENYQTIIIVAKLTLKSIEDSSTSTLYISNRHLTGDADSLIYNIINSIGTITSGQDGYIPTALLSTIILNNKENSLGFQRKFSDLLATHTIANQTIEIKFINFPDDAPIDLGLFFTGFNNFVAHTYYFKMQKASADLEAGTITLNLKSELVKDKVLSVTIDSDSYTASDYLNKAIGKTLPIILGDNAQVKPQVIASDAFAIGTLYNQHYNTALKTVNSYYCKCKDGIYRDVQSASNVSTAVYTQNIGSSKSISDPGTIKLGDEIIGFTTSNDGYAITYGTMVLKGSAGNIVAYGDAVEFQVLKVDVTGLTNLEMIEDEEEKTRVQVIGSTVVDAQDYESQFETSSNFTIAFKFATPVIIGANKAGENFKYYLAYKVRSSTLLVLTPHFDASSDRSNISYFGDNNILQYSENLDYTWDFSLYGCKFNEFLDGNSQVRDFAYFTITQNANSSADVSKLDFILDVNGLCKDSDNTYHSSNPYRACKLLLGTSLNDSNFSSTHAVFESGHTYFRKLGGVLTGRVTLLSALEQICRQSQSRLVADYAFNDLSLWAWGTANTTSLEFDDTKIISSTLTVGDIGNISNTINAIYAKSLLLTNDDDLVNIAQGGDRGFASVLTLTLNTNSITLYGANEIINNRFDLISDSTSMTSVANALIRQGSFAPKYYVFRTPLHCGTSLAVIRPMSIIEVTTAKLPSFMGTSSRPFNYHYDGQDLIRPETNEIIRAKKYRAQIINKTVTVINNVPVIEFMTKILDNYKDSANNYLEIT